MDQNSWTLVRGDRPMDTHWTLVGTAKAGDEDGNFKAPNIVGGRPLASAINDMMDLLRHFLLRLRCRIRSLNHHLHPTQLHYD